MVDPEPGIGNPEDQRGQVLTVDHFKELVAIGEFDSANIGEADIHDRSKGDILFKLVAMFQTSWFIAQCIARGQQQLALTVGSPC